MLCRAVPQILPLQVTAASGKAVSWGREKNEHANNILESFIDLYVY